MTHGLTLELAQQANLVARNYHPALYCSVHAAVANLPAEPPEYPGGPFYTRSVRVHYAAPPRRVHLLTAESQGDDEALLQALHDKLTSWELSGAEPEDSLFVTEERAAELLALATHSLTPTTERTALLGKYLRWQNEEEARAIAARLTARIEARSPGVLQGRGWMPHSELLPRPSPHPFAAWPMNELNPYAATLRTLDRRARRAPIAAVRALFADNLDRLRAARRGRNAAFLMPLRTTFHSHSQHFGGLALPQPKNKRQAYGLQQDLPAQHDKQPPDHQADVASLLGLFLRLEHLPHRPDEQPNQKEKQEPPAPEHRGREIPAWVQ